MNEQEKKSVLQLITKSVKDSFVWILGGEPYKEKVIFDLNPENEIAATGESKINWTRVLIFFIGFGFIFMFLYPIVKNFVVSIPNKIRR